MVMTTNRQHGAQSGAANREALLRELQAALEHLNAGRVAAAAALVPGLRQAAPNDPAVLQLAATTALRQNQPVRALELAQESLRHRPGHPPTLTLAARAAKAGGLAEQAEDILRTAIAAAPGSVEPAFLLCHWAAERSADTLPAMLAGLASRFPRVGAEWQRLGLGLLRSGQIELAFDAFARADDATAPNAQTLLGRGLALRERGRMTEARMVLQSATEQDRDAWPASFALGLTCQDLGDEAAAALAYQDALRSKPDLAEAAVNLGIARQRLGDMDGALAAYRQAVRARPDTFGRISQAMTSAATGALWLDLEALRRSLLA
jgi:tetratricopeptide (TPR) repeat protein